MFAETIHTVGRHISPPETPANGVSEFTFDATEVDWNGDLFDFQVIAECIDIDDMGYPEGVRLLEVTTKEDGKEIDVPKSFWGSFTDLRKLLKRQALHKARQLAGWDE